MKKSTLKEQLKKAKYEIIDLKQRLENSYSAEEHHSLIEDFDDAQSEIIRLTENFDYAMQALRANRIEDALHELENALPDEFVGFAETIIKWSRRS